jgi:hypothetical protein
MTNTNDSKLINEVLNYSLEMGTEAHSRVIEVCKLIAHCREFDETQEIHDVLTPYEYAIWEFEADALYDLYKKNHPECTQSMNNYTKRTLTLFLQRSHETCINILTNNPLREYINKPQRRTND